jgi:hypothetical protein
MTHLLVSLLVIALVVAIGLFVYGINAETS